MTATGLDLLYDDRVVARNLSLDVPESRLTAIVGPNACGKSTLLRALARLLAPRSGHVLLGDRDIRELAPKQMARQVGLLPQSADVPVGVSVAELVARGRHPHQRMWQQWSADDAAIVERAMRATGVAGLAERQLDELSGGQRQRAWLALLLAQDTPILLLDEPTTFLDVAHQLDVLEMCRTLTRDLGRTVVVVLHDLDQACAFADHLLVMRDGAILAAGPPRDIVTEELIARAFSVRALVNEHPVTGAPHVLPIASLTGAGQAEAGAATSSDAEREEA